MVNRTGQQQGIQRLSRQSAASSVSPVIQYAAIPTTTDAGAKAAWTLGGILDHLSTRVEDRLDVQAKIEGAREGTIAGGQDSLPTLQDDATLRGAAFNAAAKDTAIMRLDMDARQHLTQLEDQHKANPEAFLKAADAYLGGSIPAIEQFDPALSKRYEAEFQMRKDAAAGRIKTRHQAIVRDQQLELVLRQDISLQEEMANDAALLFAGDAQQTQVVMTRMISNAAKLVDNSNQIGPDGRPLMDARGRIAAQREAENMMSEQIGLSWMQKQPDMLSAYRDWQRGTATIDLADENGNRQTLNLKEVLGARGYAAAGKTFIENMRSELALQNQITTAQDRAFKKRSDQLFSELSVRAQDGDLTLSQVDGMRRMMEPDQFIALRSVAKSGGGTVSDGAIYSDLAIRAANGEDVRGMLWLEHEVGNISSKDYIDLYNRNITTVDAGTKDPVVVGRNYLTQSLGALSKEIGLAQSASIGQAEAEYEIQVGEFIEREGRQPGLREARDLADTVRVRYSVLSVKDSLLSLPLPQTMTQAEKLSKELGAASIEKKVEKTNQIFLEKHSGNINQRNADPAYLREINLLKNYHELLQLKEQEHGTGSRPTK